MADPYYLTHTGEELDAAIDVVSSAQNPTVVILSTSDITVAGSQFGKVLSVTNPILIPMGAVLSVRLSNGLSSQITPENIKAGVTILGITGTYTGE